MLAGDGEPVFVSGLKALAQSGDGRDRIDFAGWVTGDDKLALVYGAQVFALPSQQENFGIAVVEALAAGVPAIVTTGVNLAPEISAAGAGWVTERDVDALALTLRSTMSDGSERERRGRCARRFAEQFRWSSTAASLRDVYRDVLKTGRRVPVGWDSSPANQMEERRAGL